MVDILGVVLAGVAHGDGSGAGDRVDPVLLHLQAGNRVVACSASVPRRDHSVREVRQPLLERGHGSHGPEAHGRAAEVAGFH